MIEFLGMITVLNFGSQMIQNMIYVMLQRSLLYTSYVIAELLDVYGKIGCPTNSAPFFQGTLKQWCLNNLTSKEDSDKLHWDTYFVSLFGGYRN